MNLIKWKRPSGRPLETNDRKETIAHLESLGYSIIKSKNEKDELEDYAREEFGVELDKRKSLSKLKAEVKALEAE